MKPRLPHFSALSSLRKTTLTQGFTRISLRTTAIVLLALCAITAIAAWRATVSQAAQEQPSPGPGLPRAGSNAPKSAASSNKPGSVLFFHRFTSEAAKPSGANTLLTLTNTNPRDSVAVQLILMNNCAADDRLINLAPNQTRTLLMSKEKPGASGYAMAVAVNAEGAPTQFNWLTGSASLRDARGHEYNYNALAVAKRTAGAIRLDSNGDAELSFDNTEYDRLPKIVALDNIQNQATGSPDSIQTDFTIYTPAAQPHSSNYDPTQITATIYNQQGRPFAEVLDNVCALSLSLSQAWAETPINEIITAGQSGWATFAASRLETGKSVPIIGLSLTETFGTVKQHNARTMQVLEWLDQYKIKIASAFNPEPPADVATNNQPEATGGATGVSESKAGSILIFSHYLTADGGNTKLNLTNTNNTQKIRVRLFFSNLVAGSQITDKVYSLNAGQTLTLDGAAVAPDIRGWVMAMAIDGGGRPSNFNHLIGSAVVMEPADSGASSAAYNALAIAKNSPGPVERNADAVSADLLFDDVNYDRLPATAALSAVPNQDEGATTLGFARPPITLLNGTNVRGSVSATVYDDAFMAVGTTIGRTEVRLSTLRASNSSQAAATGLIGKGHRGWMKMLIASPMFAWSNTLATSEFVADGHVWSGSFSGGANLHYLTAADSYRITAPASNPDNHIPTAVADVISPKIEARSAKGTIVRLDASASYDDDGEDKLTYQWRDVDKLVSTSRVSDLLLGIGHHGITLTVTDSSGASSVPDEQFVEIADTTAPQISGLPASITRSTASHSGATVNYQLPVAYDMVDGWVPVAASRTPGSNFPLGVTVVTFTARDKAGNTATASVNVLVVLSDKEQQSGGEVGSVAPYMENLQDQHIPAGSVRDIPLKAFDTDNDPVVFTLQGNSARAQIVDQDAVARTATLRITPSRNDPPADLRIVVTDNRRQVFRTLPFRVVVSDIPNDDSGGGRDLTNRPPVAVFTPVAAVMQATDKDGVNVTLDGSKSSDPDGDALNFVWSDNSTVIAQGMTVTVKLGVGKHTLVLTVSDGSSGVTNSSTVNVEVLPRSLSILSVSPNRVTRGNNYTLTINGTGIVPGTTVRFSKSGINVLKYVSVNEDQIVADIEILKTTSPGSCDVLLITPTGKSIRLRSGLYINP